MNRGQQYWFAFENVGDDISGAHVLLAVEHEVLVDLVGEDEQIPLARDRAQRLELEPREHLARRISRRVHLTFSGL
jgi:hypothetical protein